MAEVATLYAAARVPLPDAHGMLAQICAHFEEHGIARLDGDTG
ncbi:DUF2218 domain-containing protein [Microvirga brassicacearum]|nr:DUF2218 domain-containing protein [Microvirga brassicacearum]